MNYRVISHCMYITRCRLSFVNLVKNLLTGTVGHVLNVLHVLKF